MNSISNALHVRIFVFTQKMVLLKVVYRLVALSKLELSLFLKHFTSNLPSAFS
jgi:hypothetical protein